MRVAIFEPFGNLYGSERSLLDLLSALPRDEATPVVYCPKGAPWIAELERRGVRYAARFQRDLHLRSRVRRVGALLKFTSFLLRERIDLIHANQTGAAPYALVAGSLLRLPVVVHARWPEDDQAINSWTKGVAALRAVICTSEYQRASIAARAKVSPEKIVLVRNPYRCMLDREAFLFQQSTQPLFVCPARIHPLKRQDLLLAAAKIYLDRHGPCTIRFLGDEAQGSGFLDALREQASAAGIDRHLEFLGYVRDVHAHLSEAAAMVLPTQFEAVGRVVFEAWDAGTIPIAWRESGGPAEIIDGSRGGILYSEQKPEALAGAMHEAASLSAATRAEMTARGLCWLEQNCAPEEHARKILSVWQDALSGSSSELGHANSGVCA